MSQRHLILVTLGPVQEFIAQSRRTRDLWHGSHLLSELSRCAARELARAHSAKLIFPASDKGSKELDPCPEPTRGTRGEQPLNVANRILADLPPQATPADVARKVRCAVQTFWRDEIAGNVRANKDCRPLLRTDIDEVWNEQVATFIEFVAAWTSYGTSDGKTYSAARVELDRAIAGRKNLREFVQWQQHLDGARKSSLDGARVSVLASPETDDASRAYRKAMRKYRIGVGEELDAVGLIKRAGGDPEQFTPIVNVGLATWLQEANRVASKEMAKLRKACAELALPRVMREPAAQAFDFDASVFLTTRLPALFKEQSNPDTPRSEYRDKARKWAVDYVRPVLRKMPVPYPYVACLVADGDHMGRAISALESIEAHQAFSRHLSQFAKDARSIVETDHQGLLVYSGGDDVLAFLPLPTALACADALRQEFLQIMAGARESIVEQFPGLTLPESWLPTLSVGIGIGHTLESMSELLNLGRDAEKSAKGHHLKQEEEQRNALAVIVDKRSGGRREWRGQWPRTKTDINPAEVLLVDFDRLTSGQLPLRKIHQIAETLARLPPPRSIKPDGDAQWRSIVELEVRRSLARVHGGGTKFGPQDVNLAISNESYAKAHADVERWIERQLIARTFGDASVARGKKTEQAA